MAKIGDIDQESWNEWVSTRTDVIKAMCATHPPDRLYRLKSSDHRVVILSYSEDGTVTIAVTGDYNLVVFERKVFGISPESLEECDLPGDGEVLGVMFKEPDEIDVHVQLSR